MKVWIDAQLPPSLAAWMSAELGVDATAVRDLGLRDAPDRDIFMAARAANAAVLTKDADFIALLERFGPPPAVLWVTSGNTSNARMREILAVVWPRARALLEAGENLVEITHR